MIIKRFTIVSSLLFVFLFCGMVGYVASSKDFMPPKEEEAVVPAEEDKEMPVWNKTVDELVSFPEEKGLIQRRKRKIGVGIAFLVAGAVMLIWGIVLL